MGKSAEKKGKFHWRKWRRRKKGKEEQTSDAIEKERGSIDLVERACLARTEESKKILQCEETLWGRIRRRLDEWFSEVLDSFDWMKSARDLSAFEFEPEDVRRPEFRVPSESLLARAPSHSENDLAVEEAIRCGKDIFGRKSLVEPEVKEESVMYLEDWETGYEVNPDYPVLMHSPPRPVKAKKTLTCRELYRDWSLERILLKSSVSNRIIHWTRGNEEVKRYNDIMEFADVSVKKECYDHLGRPIRKRRLRQGKMLKKYPPSKYSVQKWLHELWTNQPTRDINFKKALIQYDYQANKENLLIPPGDIAVLFQRPNFRRDKFQLGNDKQAFLKEEIPSYLTENFVGIRISDELDPGEFLRSLGLDVREIWSGTMKDDLRQRLETALKEARVWVNTVTLLQGRLMYLLALEVPDEVMPFYAHIVEAIVNDRITDLPTLAMVLFTVKRMIKGEIELETVYGEELTKKLKEMHKTEASRSREKHRKRFVLLYDMAKEWNVAIGKQRLMPEIVEMLARLTNEYTRSLTPFLPTLVKYIGLGYISSEIQLIAASIFIKSLNPDLPMKEEELEAVCGLGPLDLESKGITPNQAKLIGYNNEIRADKIYRDDLHKVAFHKTFSTPDEMLTELNSQ